MLKKLLGKFQFFFVSVILILFYCSEGLNKIIKYSSIEPINASRAIKFIVLIALVVGLVYKKPRIILHIILLFTFFYLGQYVLVDHFNSSVVTLFFKYIFALLLYLYFNTYILSEKQKKALYHTFEIVVIANCIFIISGFIFDIDFFQTYKGNRFGFNGLFVASATGSYVNIIALIYFVIKDKKAVYKNYKAILLILAMMLIGTKSVYISLFLIALFYVWYYFDSSLKKIILISLFGLLFVLSYLFFYSFGVFNEIRQERGVISSVLSFRNELLLKRTLPFINEQWQFVNYLFGGLSNLSTRAQLGFIDAYYFFGLIGGTYFFLLYYKSYFTFYTKKKDVYLFIILIIIIFLSGNFFANTSLPLYLLIIKLLLEETNHSKLNENSISTY